MSEKDAPNQEQQIDPAEAAQHGDPDWEANDPNDLNHSQTDEKAEGEEESAKAEDKKPEPVKAEEAEEPEAEGDEEDVAELEQLRKANKALTQRLGAVAKEKRELSAKLQESIREVPKEDGGKPEDAPQRSDFKSKKDFDDAVATHAQMLVEQQEFNRKCNAVEAAGSKVFKEKWAGAKANLAVLDDHGRIPPDILSVALETEDPARVLFVLGNDLEKATELMGMTPIKRAIAMDKIASQKPAPRQTSRAPAPIDPIGGRGDVDDKPSDRDSDEEWNRKEELRERRAAEERRKRGY